MRTTHLPSFLASILLLLFSSPLAAWPLVENGEARAFLRLPAEPHADEQLAADEISSHVEQMTGVKLEVVAGEGERAGLKPIHIGGEPPAEATAELEGKDPASFVLSVTGDGATLAGASPEGTLFAAYELLEQLGVRWYMPGELGTIIPKTDTLELQAQTTVQVPSFPARWMNAGAYDKQWGRRMRMGGPYFPSAHGLPLGDAKFETHPELFSLIDGERRHAQHCVSNPEVVRRVTEQTRAYFQKNPDSPWLGMGPNDGSGFCECEDCRALDAGDWDPLSHEPSVTDRYLWLFNQVLEGISDEFPDKKIGFYAYHTYMRPPVKTVPNPRIVPALAPITLCRVHGPDNPICPESHYYAWLVEAWGKILPEVYDRGYWFNLADPGFPFIMVHRLRAQIPLAKELGIKGWRVETMHHWASETPSLYVAAKLMWDHEADVDALVADFCEKSFGPAADPMRRYITLMDEALRDVDHHTGSSYDMPYFYPPELRDEARGLLEEGASLAKEEAHAERVAMIRASFDYLEAFIDMIDHRNAFRFAEAQKDLDRLDELQAMFLANDPTLINKIAKPYLDRFFRDATEQAHARTSGGNKLVATLADEWEFQVDPGRVGEDFGWQRPELEGGNWQRIKTSSSSWGNQGLRYYKGEAWYRQRVNVPEEFAGQRVFLWFGGVDEKAKVWVNGQEVGISHGASFIPFELDVTEAIRPGENTIVVRALNEFVDELGTGGIMAPVMLYAPAAGAEAQVENVREMGRTFP